jgi:hypothetical protein
MSDPKPNTPREWALYRTRLVCGMGKDVLNGRTAPPGGVPVIEYAMYALFDAVQELAGLVDEATKGGVS